MVEQANIITFSNIVSESPSYIYTIMIILNRPIHEEQFKIFRKMTDYVICADGAANRLYELKEKDCKECIPDWIVGDFDSINLDVKKFYEQKCVTMNIKKDQENSDLDKCLYMAMEEVAKVEPNDMLTGPKKFCFIILGSSGGRIDHTISTYHHVYKYLTQHQEQLSQTEIFMVSKSSISLFLKNGTNIIDTSESVQNKKFGYSIIPIYGEANVKVYENPEKADFKDMSLKFGEDIFFYKKTHPDMIKVVVDSEKCALLYTCTTLYYNKFA